MNITFQIFIFIVAMLSSMAIGIYVFIQNYNSFLHRSFIVFVTGLTLWGSSIAGLYITHNFVFSSLVFMSGAIWFVGFICFTYSFPHGQKPGQYFYFWFIPALLIFILAPFNVFVSNFIIDAKGYLKPVNNLLFFIPFIITFITYLAYSCFLVFKNYTLYRKMLKSKMQFRYLFTGMGIFIFSIIIFDTILPAFGIYQLNLVGPSTAVIFFGFTAYAIVRHELLDIRIVVQRGLIYAFILVLLMGIYIGALMGIEYFFREITDIQAIISAGITMMLGIIFFHPLENYFRKVTDNIFFKDRYDYADALHKLSKALHTNVTETDIISASSELLKIILKTTEVKFKLSESDQSPNSWQTVLSIPIVFEGKNIGILELGPKRSGDKYNQTDIQLLETFAYQAAVALEKGRLYEEVENHRIHLEELIEKRTSEIKKLQEDQKQAMIDISHNLQTPLAIIKGELDILNDLSINAEKVNIVKKSITRVSQFIRQLLHLAKLSHSAYSIELSRVDLTSLIREQIEYFEVMAEEKHLKIISIIPEKVFILGNKRLLEELITNLVINAIKYRRKNVKSIVTISLLDTEKDIGIVIEDNGVGINSEDLPSIFTRFYTGSRKSNTSGTGLGLAICKKIAEKHNGSISVTSTLGEKTVFIVMFPKINKGIIYPKDE